MDKQSPAAREGTSSSSSTTTIEDLHPDVLTKALCHLDGPALSAASCASTHLRSLSSLPDLWRDLCLSTWPSLRSHPHLLHLLSSFPNSYRSFFADAFPSPSLRLLPDVYEDEVSPSVLVSAIDIFHRGLLIFSRVVETDTSSPWCKGSPFRIEAVDRKDPQSLAPPVTFTPMETAISPEDLMLSWVLIDPATKRAVDVSSKRLVSVERHWLTGETLVRFATVLDDRCAVEAVITCGEDTGNVLEVSLTVEGVDGVCLNGQESLAVLAALMHGGRRRWEGQATARMRWEEFVGRRRWQKEKSAWREGALDFAYAAVGAVAFLALLVLVLFRR